MKRILFIGQAPPERMDGVPFKTTGLFRWLSSVGLEYEPRTDFKLFHNQEGVFVDGKHEISKKKTAVVAIVKFAALIDFFPGHAKSGGHLPPTESQIVAARPALRKLVSQFKPNIIVAVGKLSIQEALGREVALSDVVGKKFAMSSHGLSDVVVIPFPHPSGASTWVHMSQNKLLLKSALQLLRSEIGFTS